MDPRQQRQAYQQRPPYPQVAPQSSAFQSSSSLSSVSSSNTPALVGQLPQMSATSSAPLPSPSVQQPANYFGSLTSQPATHANHAQQQRMPPSQQQPMGQMHVGQRHGGQAPETAPFLQDFNLIAEAAKRAQMACLSRDLGDIGL